MKLQTTLLAAFSVLVLASCQQNSCKVEGTVQGLADGDTLYVTTDMESLQPKDSLFVSDGHFTYKADADTVRLTMIYSKNLSSMVMFFTEPGTVSVNMSTLPLETRIGGTVSNDGWQQLTELTNDYGQRAQQKASLLYNDSITEEARQGIFAELQALESEMQQKIVELAEQNISNEFGFFLLTNHPTGNDTFTPEKCRELIGRLPESFRQRPAVKALEEELSKSESTAVGKKISDFSFPTPEGPELSVMSQVSQNKITILDFWASWCGPCRQEMPFMKELYKNYHGKGLGIVGISLDEDHDAWVKAIKELDIAWPQMSDLKGWESEAGKMFQVSSIPFMVIVDQNGVILAKGLRGEALSSFVSKQLD